MKPWSDGAVESSSVGSNRLRPSLQYSNIPIRRWGLCLTLCAMLLALCSSVEAQQPTKIRRIGFLDRSTASGSVLFLDVFRQELSKLGWIEGKSITIEYRFAEGN